jgi:response regulator RpfG family c-di-GMP phosphodiesterase
LCQHPRFASTLAPHYIDLLARSLPPHDISKVGISDRIQLKISTLTPRNEPPCKPMPNWAARPLKWRDKTSRQP